MDDRAPSSLGVLAPVVVARLNEVFDREIDMALTEAVRSAQQGLLRTQEHRASPIAIGLPDSPIFSARIAWTVGLPDIARMQSG